MFNCSSSPNNVPPTWLQNLLTEKFYNACLIHQESKKNEKNVYCVDCCISLCSHCVPPHRSHRLLQIRRYVLNDVIRLDDASKLIDCSSIQFYRTNSAKVVFLRTRPLNKKCSSGNMCRTCARSLQDPYKFCSLVCKVNYLVKTLGSLSGYLYECNYMPLSDSGPDDDLMTPDSVLEPSGSNHTSSGSGGYGVVDCQITLACTATTEVVRKKRTGLSTFRPPCRPVGSPVLEISANMINKRKGNPQRAPLY
ncbi:protein RGF1 INDUCIBLE TRANSCRIPTION FACTOR [Trifolium repens]|nr:protein RGF1 INDUCIBLE TRANSCRIPTION FACTOR [Trifolium repens]